MNKIMYGGLALIVLAFVLRFTGVVANQVYYLILGIGIVLYLIVYFYNMFKNSDN